MKIKVIGYNNWNFFLRKYPIDINGFGGFFQLNQRKIICKRCGKSCSKQSGISWYRTSPNNSWYIFTFYLCIDCSIITYPNIVMPSIFPNEFKKGILKLKG